MADSENSGRTDQSPAAPARLGEASGLAAVESYEVDDGMVFYDPQNPLAWVETSQAVSLADRC